MLFVATTLTLLGLTLADFNFLLLHNNDMHARFQQADKYGGLCENDTSTSCYGGFPRLQRTIADLKQNASAKGLPTIFLNAGDTFQGTPYYTFFKWPIVADFINVLQLDVMSLGNHEFDDGPNDLAAFMRNVTVPIVCCNLDTALEPSFNSPNLVNSTVLTVNGVKIGVIGYLTPDTAQLSSVGKVQIKDEIACIREEARRLTAQGVKILIALGHSGYAKDQQIAKEIEDIDIVVGGHSHTFLYNGTPPDCDKPLGPYPTMVRQSSGKMVPVVQAFFATKYLGYLELDFDDQGNLKSYKGSPILLSGNMPQDPVVLEVLQPYEQSISTRIHSVLGYSDIIMDGSTPSCKLGECITGNLVTDAYVDYVVRHYKNPQGWTQAAVGINQAGGMRGTIDTLHNEYHNGSINLGDVLIVLPWGSPVLILTMTGQTLFHALEFSVARYEETITGHVSEFLQVSGLHVVYDMSQPSGHRVVSVYVLCADCRQPQYQPLNVTKTYGVVLPDYIGRGGDGFSMFENCMNRTILDDVEYQVVAEYIQAHSPVYPRLEGRIIVLNNATTPSSASTTTISWTALVAITLLFILNCDNS